MHGFIQRTMQQRTNSLPSTRQSTGLVLEEVRLQRGKTVVFEGLSLALPQARIGLIGDNGAGKSSLFRVLCGLDQPQSGRVQVPDGAQAVGMMFQNPDDQIIFPTVEEELALSLQHLPITRAQAQQQVRAVLQARGLAHWASRAIASLSQGQRQHVCWLALTLAPHRVLLLDEPFASLDLPGQALLKQEIAQASQQVLVSTHVLGHVRHFERVIWLDQGRVRADGVGAEVCAAYEADVASRSAQVA